jgi:hypothetical protein
VDDARRRVSSAGTYVVERVASQPRKQIQTPQPQEAAQVAIVRTQPPAVVQSIQPGHHPEQQKPPLTLTSFVVGATKGAQDAGQRFAEKHPGAAKAIYTPAKHATTSIHRAGAHAEAQQIVGTEKAKDIEYSQVSQTAHRVGTDVSSRIKTVGQESAEYYRKEMPVTGKYFAGVAEVGSTAISKVPEFLGMVPGGVETIAKRPEVIPAALAVGLHQSTLGTTREFIHHPVQTTADVGAFMLIGGGVKGGAGKVRQVTTPLAPRTTVKPPTPTGLTPGKSVKFEAGYQLTKAVETTKPPTQPVDFTNVKYLPGRSGPAVEQWIRSHPKQDPVIGGSTAAQAHFPSARRGADIDLLVKDPKAASVELYRVVERELGPEHVRLVSDPKWGAYAVETRASVKGDWHHGVDIHKSTEPGSQLRYGFETQSPVKVEGIQYQRAGELIQRKAETVLQPSDPGTIGPTKAFRPQRQKDIPDYETYVSDTLALKKQQAEQARFFSGHKQRKVEALEETFETYKMHSAMGPDPYTVISAAEWYGAQPAGVKAGVALAGIGRYGEPQQSIQRYEPYQVVERKVQPEQYHEPYQVEPKKYDTGYGQAHIQKEVYAQPHYPVAVKETYLAPSNYPVAKSGGRYDVISTPRYDQPYEPYDPYTPSPAYTPYIPPTSYTPATPATQYTPLVSSPQFDPMAIPPEKTTKWHKLKSEDEDKKKKKKAKKSSRTSRKVITWYPASLGSVTAEHFQTGGKLSVHIAPAKTTRELMREFIQTGRGIPTAKQHKRSN